MAKSNSGFEKRKVAIDLFKHFSTVSIGVLALSAAFLGNLNKLDGSTTPLVIAVICFFIVIVSSSICKILIVSNIEEWQFRTLSHYITRISAIVTIFGFFTGAASFVYLILVNA